jgi:restriction system protein
MEAIVFFAYFFYFFLLFLIVKLIGGLFSKKKKDKVLALPRIHEPRNNELIYLGGVGELQKPKHGHRCYMEGLSDAEYKIATLLANNLSHKDYYIFNNLYLPSKINGTTQIDHIVVSRFGVFVIESKHCSGWVFANTNKRADWYLTTGKNKYPFYSPVRQNHAHVCAILEQMGFLKDRVEGLVVFTGDYVFKTPKPKKVFSEEDLVDYIKSKKQRSLKEGELFAVIGKLSMLCQTNDTTKEEHIETVRSLISRKSDDLVLKRLNQVTQ